MNIYDNIDNMIVSTFTSTVCNDKYASREIKTLSKEL